MAYTYLLPIKTAAALFPLLALLLLLPTAVVLYRRHGVMTSGRFLSLFAFGHYLLTAACLTVVPLPAGTVDVCAEYAAMASPQLVPGNTFGDIWKEAHHRTDIGSLVLHNPAVAGAAFNLLLLVPLGVFLRYHFRRGPLGTACAGLGLSLAFELTQWTGVLGLYPCPYRLFDVDDLAVNTSGAVLGWALTGPALRLLPALETLDGRALSRVPVPFGRRLTALLADLIGVSLTGALCVLAASYSGLWDEGGVPVVVPLLVCAVWFVALPYATGGTPGKRLLRLCLVTDGGGPAALWRLTLRAVMLAGVSAPLLSLLLVAGLTLARHPSPFALAASAWPADLEDAAALASRNAEDLTLAVAAFGAAVLGALLPLTVLRDRGGPGPHERLSGVRNAALPPTRAARVGREPASEAAGAAGTAAAAGVPWAAWATWSDEPSAPGLGSSGSGAGAGAGSPLHARHPVVPVRLATGARRRPHPRREPRHARPGPRTLSVPPTAPGDPRPWRRDRDRDAAVPPSAGFPQVRAAPVSSTVE